MSHAEIRYIGLSLVGFALGAVFVSLPHDVALAAVALVGYAVGSFVAFKVVTR